MIDVAGNPVWCDTADQPFRPEQPNLVFIHGALNDHSVWNRQSRYFAGHGCNVFAPDLPGHGKSAGDALTNIEALALWLTAWFDAVGLQRAGLIGHSMGSLIALETARTAPDRVSRLALLGTAFPMKVADALLDMARDDEAAAIELVTGWSHLNSGPDTDNPGFNLPDQTRRLMQRMSELNPARLLYTDLAACNAYRQGDAAAAVINRQQLPVLCVMALQDRMTPVKSSAALRQAMAHSQTVEISHCGHSMMAEQPEAILAALVQFLK